MLRRGTQIEGVCEQNAEDNFGPQRDEVTGGLGKLPTEELHKANTSLGKI
jgi:hypothetical protein